MRSSTACVEVWIVACGLVMTLGHDCIALLLSALADFLSDAFPLCFRDRPYLIEAHAVTLRPPESGPRADPPAPRQPWVENLVQ